MSNPKEVHFFDIQFDRGANWYRSHFPLSPVRHDGMLLGEASPYYLIQPHAPRRAAQLLPSVRLICLIRDPTERAISHYFHEVALGEEWLPIEEAMEAERKRVSHEWDRLLRDPSYVSPVHQSYSYKQRGLYADQIERWLEYFPPERLLILPSETFYRETDASIGRVAEFLGLAHIPGSIETPVKNARSIEAEVPRSVRADLREHFAGPNERLYELLGEDLGFARDV